MPRINVLKPFVFSSTGAHGSLPVEKRFTVGEHEIDESLANHPWIKSHADGHIETPEAAKRRADAARAQAVKIAEDAAYATALADEAYARLTLNSEANAKQSALSAEALNTPVNELQAKRGEGTETAATGITQDELNTPVNTLKLKK